MGNNKLTLMKIIRNKKTGEILQVSEGDLAKYGLGGQTHSSKGKKVLRSFQQGGIRDYLFSKGVDGSKANRTKLFNKYFDGKYTGTAEQNIKLLSDIKSGKIKINGDINPWVNTGAKADIKKQIPIKVNPWSNIGERAQAEQTGQKAKTNIASTAFKISPKPITKVNPWSNIGNKIKEDIKIIDNDLLNNSVKEQLKNSGKYFIIDKATNMAYWGDGKNNYNKKVGLGANTTPTTSLKGPSVPEIKKLISEGKYKEANDKKLTTMGVKPLNYINDIYGSPGFQLGNTNEAIHTRYSKKEDPKEYNRRISLEKQGNYNYSYGCVNVDDEGKCIDGISPLQSMLNTFSHDRNKADSLFTFDTRLSDEQNYEVLRNTRNIYKNNSSPISKAISRGSSFQGGGGYTDKTGSHFNIKNFFNQNNQTSLDDCPIGYKWSVADQQCLPDEQAIASNFSGDRNKFITGTINQNGEKVGGTNAQPTMSHQPNASDNNYINNSDMNLKRVFGTPNIPAILASNLLLSGLSAFGNNVEEGRQKASAMNQMNNPAFNQTYSYAQPDYGADPYEQTGQKRKTIFKIGGKFRELQGGGGFNAYDFLYGDDEDTTQKKSNDTTKNKKRVTESEVDDSQAQLEAIGLSDMDILNMPSPIRRNISSEEYSPDSSSNYSSQGSNNYGELYLQHQQGATGIRLIKQAAEQGLDVVPRSWNKENIQSNMRNNVSKDFKGPVTPAKFLEYWNGKINRHMAKVANKETPYDSIFQKVGQEEGINPIFLKAVANIESGINPNNNTKSKYKGITALNYNTYGKKVFDPYFSLSTTAKSFKQEGGTYSTEDISKLPSNFAMGGVFELNESDIQKLIKQGYKIDRL